MKKLSKIVTVLLIIMTLLTITTNVMAAITTPTEVNGTGATMNTSSIETMGQGIFTVVRTIGIVASVVFLIILGIKYMMGSVEEKAEYKKTLLPYALGAIFVFGAAVIAGWFATIIA